MGKLNRSEAQRLTDRILALREDLKRLQEEQILELTTEQRARFDAWSAATLHELKTDFDVDTTEGQRQITWGMKIASTLGGFALCAAVVLFFLRFWGYLATPVQLSIAMAAPLAALAGTEYAARRDRTMYFAGLLALVSLACFVLNLIVVGSIFNIHESENALLAWGLFGLLIAYRYGLRLILGIGIALLVSWFLAWASGRFGYHWLSFGDRPEHFLLAGVCVFAVPLLFRHDDQVEFPFVYRCLGLLAIFISMFFLGEAGGPTYLPFSERTVKVLYEMVGLATSAAAVWLGIRRGWIECVNIGSVAFTIFLLARISHWFWDLLPKYLFFALIGAIGLGLMLAFRRIRTHGQESALEEGGAA